MFFIWWLFDTSIFVELKWYYSPVVLQGRFDHPYIEFLFYGEDTSGDFIPIKQLREKYDQPRYEASGDETDNDDNTNSWRARYHLKWYSCIIKLTCKLTFIPCLCSACMLLEVFWNHFYSPPPTEMRSDELSGTAWDKAAVGELGILSNLQLSSAYAVQPCRSEITRSFTITNRLSYALREATRALLLSYTIDKWKGKERKKEKTPLYGCCVYSSPRSI